MVQHASQLAEFGFGRKRRNQNRISKAPSFPLLVIRSANVNVLGDSLVGHMDVPPGAAYGADSKLGVTGESGVQSSIECRGAHSAECVEK